MNEEPKTKAPRRSDDAIAADYAARGEAARVRGIKRSEEYTVMSQAATALHAIPDGWLTVKELEAVKPARAVLTVALERLLAKPEPKP